jgi:GYF domain 2
MSSKWYIIRQGQQIGPFEFDQLKQLATSGALTAADAVWNEPSCISVPARMVPGLLPNSSTTMQQQSGGEHVCSTNERPSNQSSKTGAYYSVWFLIVGSSAESVGEQTGALPQAPGFSRHGSGVQRGGGRSTPGRSDPPGVDAPLAHRRAEYPLAGCVPAEPDSVSSAI